MAARVEIYDARTETWPIPDTLKDDLPPVARFELEFIPESFRRLIADVSERMQVPPDYAGASAIAALAGCVNRRVVVQPRAHDESWSKSCNLWGGIIGPPGVLKSPVLAAVTRPLTQIEEVFRAKYKEEIAAYELEKEQADLELQAWREQSKAALKNKRSPPPRPDTLEEKPTQTRLVLQDATFEKLHEILADNPAGVLVLRDELTGWLSQLDRQGREGERAFYLTAWNGNSGHTIDRIGRGSIYVPHVCVSLFGGIQPSRLRSYLADALEDGPANDGLAQRLQNSVWPDPPKTWKLVDRAPDREAEEQAQTVFETLANLPLNDPPRLLRFSPDAQELFNAWEDELEHKVRGGRLHPALTAHLAKYRSLMPVLAGLFELADSAARLGGGHAISLSHTQQSAALCEYYESHAGRIYSCVASPEVRAARELAQHIKRRELGKRFSLRDVYRHDWSGLTTPARAHAAIDILVDAGWLRLAPTKDGGGRPSESFDINPALTEEK